jgi:hypothetical protein
LWFDEILTLAVAKQESWKRINAALRVALDSHPPIFYVIENFALKLFTDEDVALRLPSIAAFPCTLLCIFLYTKRLAGELVGFLSILFLLMTAAFSYYAIEARGYSMVVACIAFALVCYERVPSKIWTILFALSLAMAQSLHYYAVFAMAPFGLAELAYALRTKKIRWGVWASVAFGMVPLLIFWPLLAELKAYYGPVFWMQYHANFLPQTYGDLLQTDRRTGAGIAAVVLAGLLLKLFSEWSANHRIRETAEEGRRRLVLLFGITVLPFVGHLATTMMHTELVNRYVLSVVLGIAVGLAVILGNGRRTPVLLFGVFVVCGLSIDEIHFWRSIRAETADMKAFADSRDAVLNKAGNESLSIVVPNGLAVMPLAHYIQPALARRLVFLTPEEHVTHIDKELQLYRNYSPVQVATFSNFTSAKSQFLLYEDDTYGGIGAWIRERLEHEGWSTELVASGSLAPDRSLRVYLYKKNPAAR